MNHLANTDSMEDVVKGILRREGDTVGANFFKYMAAAKDTYMDLNLHTVRETSRMWIAVDKRTNSIRLPLEEGYLLFSSISVFDECGLLKPLVINRNLLSDIVDISQDKSCHCECGCNSSTCGSISNFETIKEIVEAKMPDGSFQNFEQLTKTRTNPDGTLVIERTFPKAIYNDGTWTSTELVVEIENLCKLDVKACGCIKETDENVCNIKKCCGDNFLTVGCGCTNCNAVDELTYNIAEGGDRIDFPSGFHYDKVLLRFFRDYKTHEIRIPKIATRAMMYGIKADVGMFDKTQPMNRNAGFADMYKGEKNKLSTIINRFSLRGFYDSAIGRNKRMP